MGKRKQFASINIAVAYFLGTDFHLAYVFGILLVYLKKEEKYLPI